MEFNIILFPLLFLISSISDRLPVKLCKFNGKVGLIFDQIFGEGWENEKMENEQNAICQTDQNSNWQNDQNELNSAVYIGKEKDDDQFDDQHKCAIVHKFHAIKERIKKRSKYSANDRYKIERKIAKKLGIYLNKIYKWQKEFGLSQKRNQKNYYENKKKEFVLRIDEIKRMMKNGKQKQFVEEFGIGKTIFMKWKKEFGIEIGKNGIRYSTEEKKRLMNFYYQIKRANPKMSDEKIANLLKIAKRTLRKWKQQTIIA